MPRHLARDEAATRRFSRECSAASPQWRTHPIVSRFTAAPDAPIPAELAPNDMFDRRPSPRRPGPVHFGASLPGHCTARARNARRRVHHHACTRLDPRTGGAHDRRPFVSASPRALPPGDAAPARDPRPAPGPTRARVVVAPSEFSRRDIIERLDLPGDEGARRPQRCRTAGCRCATPRADESIANSVTKRVRNRFVLYLGNLHPRKNVGRLVQAFRRAAPRRRSARHRRCALVRIRSRGTGGRARATGRHA